MANWYLSSGGTKKTFDDWGFSSLKRSRTSQGIDKITFEAEGQLVDAPSALGFGETVIIYKDNVQWFVGVVTTLPVRGSESEESATYEVSGPWYFFNVIIFEQPLVGCLGPTTATLNPPFAVTPTTDITVNEGDTYVSSDGSGHTHNTPYPDSLFHTFQGQEGGLLVQGGSGIIFGTAPTSHVFLNGPKYNTYGQVEHDTVVGPAGETYFVMHLLSTKEQITQVLNYVIAAQTAVYGAPFFQIGIIDPDLPAMISEVRDMSVAEVIRNQLRWTPDAVTWFDYSTSPPTLNIAQRAKMDAILFPTLRGSNPIQLTNVADSSLTTVTIPVTGGWEISNLTITPRDDLQVPFVKLSYEQTNRVGPTQFTTRAVDIYPTNAPQYGFGALVATVDLRGMNTGAYTQIGAAGIPVMNDGQVVTPPTIGGPSTDPLAWWLNRSEWPLMQADDVVVDKIILNARNPLDSGGNFIDPGLLPYEVVSGSIAPWLNGYSSREQITATLYYHTLNGQQFIKPISTTLVSASVPSGFYYDQSEVTYAEPLPVGLAQLLYNSTAALQYDGQLTISEEECSELIGMGQVLNLAPNWTAMNAMVVQISEDIENGTTQVAFGPKKNLGVSDLVELVRVIRSRVITFRLTDAFGGGRNSSAIGLPNRTGAAQSDQTSGVNKVIVASQVADPDGLKISDPTNPAVRKITIDSTTGTITAIGRDQIVADPSHGVTPAPGDGKMILALTDMVPTVSGTPSGQYGRFRPVRIAHMQKNAVIMSAATDPMPDAVEAANSDLVIGDGVANPAAWV